MKVLLINGSVHEKGCTYTALSEVAKALNDEGIESEIMHIGGSEISGCRACGACRKNSGLCVFGGIVNEAIEKLDKADALVLGSPVYFAGVNGAFCAMLDRMFYAGRSKFINKPAACVVSARRAGTTVTIDRLAKYPQISGMPLISSQYWNMVHGNKPEQVEQDLEGMQIMRQLGRNMAWILKCIEAGKEKGIAVPEREAAVTTNFIR